MSPWCASSSSLIFVFTGFFPLGLIYIILWIITPPAGVGVSAEEPEPPHEESDIGKGI